MVEIESTDKLTKGDWNENCLWRKEVEYNVNIG